MDCDNEIQVKVRRCEVLRPTFLFTGECVTPASRSSCLRFPAPRSVLDTFTDSGSLRALWAAACPPSHDPRRPFPYNSMAHFCVGGTVEVAMAVGGFTAVRECGAEGAGGAGGATCVWIHELPLGGLRGVVGHDRVRRAALYRFCRSRHPRPTPPGHPPCLPPSFTVPTFPFATSTLPRPSFCAQSCCGASRP